MPRPDPRISSWEYEHKDPAILAVMRYLWDWWDALEDGSVVNRLPDYDYQRPRGKSLWTEADLDRILLAIDDEFDKDFRSTPGNNLRQQLKGIELHRTEFSRIMGVQRLAFVQGLEQVMESHRGKFPKHSTVDAVSGPPGSPYIAGWVEPGNVHGGSDQASDQLSDPVVDQPATVMEECHE